MCPQVRAKTVPPRAAPILALLPASAQIGDQEMADMIKIMILASECTRVDAYREWVDETARDLGLNYSLEKVTDFNRIKDYHLIVRCVFYCPGCHVLSYGWPKSSGMYAPALVVNGHLKLHSCIPSRELLEEILSEYI
jgi:hypothetical protein